MKRDIEFYICVVFFLALFILLVVRWASKTPRIEAETSTNAPTINELVRRASLAGLAMGLNRGREGYEALSNEIWACYTETNPNEWRGVLKPAASNYTLLGDGTTNIIINKDYAGIIQIGTNVWRVDDLLRRK